MHGDEEVKTAKKNKPPVVSRPIPRLDIEINPDQAKHHLLGISGVLLLAFLVGWLPIGAGVRSFLGMLGLGLAAFPLSLYGYHFTRDRDEMFAFTGEELYRRAGIVAAGYVFLWFGFEYCLSVTQANAFVSWLYFAAFAVLAASLAHPVLALKMMDALLHYCFFSFSIVLLRFFIGFGWFWIDSGLIRYSTVAPPPPLLPGM